MGSRNESYPDQAISSRKFGGSQDNVKITTPISFINFYWKVRNNKPQFMLCIVLEFNSLLIVVH